MLLETGQIRIEKVACKPFRALLKTDSAHAIFAISYAAIRGWTSAAMENFSGALRTERLYRARFSSCADVE